MVRRIAAEPVTTAAYRQGESLRLDGRSNRLLWVDMRDGAMFSAHPDGMTTGPATRLPVAPAVGCVAPASAGGFLVAAGRDVLAVAADGSVSTVLPDVLADDRCLLNDGVCAPDGSFWVGSQSHARLPEAALYHVTTDGSVQTVLTGVTVSNGISFTPDGRLMYYVDTLPGRALEVFDVIGGALRHRRQVFRFEQGNPDGIAVDESGCVWVALWDAALVQRISPDGRVLLEVDVGTARPTSVALHGGYCYISTASVGVEADDERAGRIHAAEVGVGAAPTPCWAGGVS
nr:SMP-30/gluconolactonase/LRE family protein [Ruania suaedae]